MTTDHEGVTRFKAAGRKVCSLYPLMSVLYGRVRSITHAKGLGTAAVDRNWNIIVDGDWAMQQPEQDLLFILAHEIMHPLLEHHQRGLDLGLFDAKGKPKPGRIMATERWGMAIDMVINTALQSIGLPIAKGGLLPPSDYQGDLDAESVWLALKGDTVKDPPGYVGRGMVVVGAGCQTQPGDDPANERGDKPDMALARAEMALVARGDSGGGVLARILAPKRHAEEDWVRILKGAYQTTAARRGYEQTTYARPKRAGSALLPRYRATQPTLAVIVDVSGSMSGPLLDKIVDQVFDLSRAYPQVECCLVTHHSDVAWSGWINGQTNRSEIAKATNFSGGTCFGPAYRRVEEMCGGNTDVVVHLTDCMGEAVWPDVPAKRLIVGDYSPPGSQGTPPRHKRTTVIKFTVPSGA